MKVYSIRVNASPRFPVWENFIIKGSSWRSAISKAVAEYFKKHKHLRADFCVVKAEFVSKVIEEKGGK